MATFAVEVAEMDGRRAVVSLRGELDVYTAARMTEHVNNTIAAGNTVVVLDLRELTFIDSTGLAAFVAALKRARSVGGDVTLRGPSQQARKLLELTGLTKVFTIEDDSETTPPKGHPAAA